MQEVLFINFLNQMTNTLSGRKTVLAKRLEAQLDVLILHYTLLQCCNFQILHV